MATGNTGNVIVTTLLAVSDLTGEPVDCNGIPTAISGDAQCSKSNLPGDPNYISPYEDISRCPPPPPDCPTRTLVFQICNENAAKDDNFDIYLNSHYIGAVDLNYDAQIGSVFIASLDTSVDLVSSDFACPLSGMTAYYFDPTYVAGGTNTINMVNTQANGNGNLGTIGIRNYLQSGTNLSSPCFIADLEYSPPNGGNWETTFDYTSCCSGDTGSTLDTTITPEIIGSVHHTNDSNFELRYWSSTAITTEFKIFVDVFVHQGGSYFQMVSHGEITIGVGNTQSSTDLYVPVYGEIAEGVITDVEIHVTSVTPNPAGGSNIFYTTPVVFTV